MPRIEILYFEGCPNHLPAVEQVRRIVARSGSHIEVKEVEVSGVGEAVAMEFLGSPSIRVDGIDIEPEARSRTDFGYSCRTYGGQGLPPDDLLIAALGGDAKSGGKNARLGLSATAGSVFAALLASACCWLPLILIAIGVSAGGVAALFETTRFFFLGMAAVLLPIGFYFTYFRKNSSDSCSTCDTVPRKAKVFNRSLLWLSTVAVIAFSAFPLYVDAFAAKPIVSEAETRSVIDVHVAGMSCDGCAVTLHNALVAVPGVTGVDVRFEESLAKVSVSEEGRPMEAAILAALERVGYSGRFDVAQATAPSSAEDEIEEATLKMFTSVEALKDHFNADKGRRRLLLLFSPT